MLPRSLNNVWCRRLIVLVLLVTSVVFVMIASRKKHHANQEQVDDYVYSFKGGNGSLQRGKSLQVNRSFMHSLGLPPRRFAELSEDTLKDFVVVTAANYGHFVETYDAVASIQVKTWCNVIYRKFDFSKFPHHFINLRIYAWKPLVIQEMLRDHDTVLWMDASFRLFKPHIDPAISRIMKTGYGVVLFSSGGGYNFGKIHKGMYEYLPTDLERQKHTGMGGATAMLLCNTRRTYERVLRWFYLCALEELCIAPTLERKCITIEDKTLPQQYLKCHRYDQSAINILASNVMDFQPKTYVTTRYENYYFNCTRRPTFMYKLLVC